MNALCATDEVLGFGDPPRQLWGVLSRPVANGAPARTAVLIVVGGPQYRAGSHRMFVSLARAFASAGYPTLRFDYQGMGDSAGELVDFTAAAPDLRAAFAALRAACPDCSQMVVWGLCDGASAAMMYVTSVPDVAGLVAVNPWARSGAMLAATRVRHYYLARLMQREFWLKVLRGDWRMSSSLRSLAADIGGLRTGGQATDTTFQAAMAEGMRRFRGRTLLVLSGNDLTAREFVDHASASADWRGVLAHERIERIDYVEADHTFSHRPWLDKLANDTIGWLHRLDAVAGASRQTHSTR